MESRGSNNKLLDCQEMQLFHHIKGRADVLNEGLRVSTLLGHRSRCI